MVCCWRSAANVAHAASLNYGFDGSERPRVGDRRGISGKTQPGTFETRQRGNATLACGVQQGPRGFRGAASLHVLRSSLLQPRGRAVMRFLTDETVSQFVLQDAREVRGNAGQALNGDSDAAVIDRARPTGGARDVRKILPGIENHADLLRRRVIELRFEIAKMIFEHVQDFAGEIGSGRAGIFQ